MSHAIIEATLPERPMTRSQKVEFALEELGLQRSTGMPNRAEVQQFINDNPSAVSSPPNALYGEYWTIVKAAYGL